MKARDIMTTAVVTAGLETPMQKIAGLLLEHGVSAVPVVDESGELAGMVSEGDLLRQSDAEREARRDWWLTLVAEGAAADEDVLSAREANPPARQIMAAPVVTVTEDADIIEIGKLLATHHIKRVPVVRGNRIVGIVSRADLVRALSMQRPEPASPPASGLFKWSHRPGASDPSHHPESDMADRDSSSKPSAFNADAFRSLAMSAAEKMARQREAERQAQARRRDAMIKEGIEHHISDEYWHKFLHEAELAAAQGAEEFMIIRFPSHLCSDGGRAINVPEPDWPATLRGEAAETYLRFERDLKPRGFHLAARVLDFPEGFLGDIGLFLRWGGGHAQSA